MTDKIKYKIDEQNMQFWSENHYGKIIIYG